VRCCITPKACDLWQEQIEQWPPSLQQVVFWVESAYFIEKFVPMCWQLPASGPSSAHVTAWMELQDKSAAGWSRPFRPCPHLPGLWELQGPAQGRPWHLVSLRE
jgi:hypothetical protein